MRFSKWQGTGNDFVLIDCRQEHIGENYAELSKKICDRHFGMGADGLLLVFDGDNDADFTMRIFNADGSEAQMCGNGIRCFARHIFQTTGAQEFSISTKAGIMRPRIITGGNLVEVDMGEPILTAKDIPAIGFDGERIIDEPLTIDGKNFRVTAVSMGNPHCVTFVKNAEGFDLEHYGKLFENHERFPERVNAEFAEVISRQRIRMRVWERGSGITLACGTGSCATLTAGVLTERTDSKAEIILDGGLLTVEWRDNNRLYMTGEAHLVYVGETTEF